MLDFVLLKKMFEDQGREFSNHVEKTREIISNLEDINRQNQEARMNYKITLAMLCAQIAEFQCVDIQSVD